MTRYSKLPCNRPKLLQYFRSWVGVSHMALLCVTACPRSELPEAAALGKAICQLTSDCPLGSVCVAGRCEPSSSCTPSSCQPDAYCDDDGLCHDVNQACLLPGDCSCYVHAMAGYVPSRGQVSKHSMLSGAVLQPQATVVTRAGRVIHKKIDTWSLTGEVSSFALLQAEDMPVLQAQTAPGTATLQAQVGLHTRCEALLENFGAAPIDGRTRFFAWDAITGTPIAGAQVVVHQQATLPPTDAQGLTLGADIPAVFDLSVFAPGYHYMTLAGLQARVGLDVGLPLLPVQQAMGGFSGNIDFEAFEAQEMDGRRRLLRLAGVGSSMPLAGLFDFETNNMADFLTRCGNNPHAAGCYKMTMGDLTRDILIPDGIIASLDDGTGKNHFDVAAPVGRRFAWGMGAELGLAKLFELGEAGFSLLWPKPGQDNSEAFFNLAGILFRLLPHINVGIKGDIAPMPTDLADWLAYSQTKTLQHRSVDPRFVMLSEDFGMTDLALTQPMRLFSAMQVPALPAGERFDTVTLTSGVLSPGWGFVPLGLGFGFDCIHGHCLDDDEGTFDGHIDEFAVCANEKVVCPPGVPERLPRDHVGLFRSPAFGGLEQQPWLTVAMALPLRDLVEQEPVSLLGLVAKGEPELAQSHMFAEAQWPDLPELLHPEPDISNRTFGFLPLPSLQYMRLAGQGETRWIIYVNPQVSQLELPEVPVGFDDLLQDINLSVWHMSTELEDTRHPVNLTDLVEGQALGLVHMPERIKSFAVRTGTLW